MSQENSAPPNGEVASSETEAPPVEATAEPEEAPALQFDRVEPVTESNREPEALSCGRCGTPIQVTYFEVNQRPHCPACRDFAVRERDARSPWRFLRACLLGAAASVAGAVAWYLISTATGYIIGLIAVAVGYLVGSVVKRAARGRGGWVYQSLAVFLTYASILGSYFPGTMKSMLAEDPKKDTAASATSTPAPVAPTGTTDKAPPSPSGPSGPSGSVAGDLMLGLAGVSVLFVIFLFTAPFLIGPADPIFLVILAFSLYEAWKLNKAPPLVVQGPFRIAGAMAGATPAAENIG